MRAVTQRSYGGPEVLEVTEVDRPEPVPSEVLVRIHASAVNPVDAVIRSGVFPLLGEPPFTLGWDIARTCHPDRGKAGCLRRVLPGPSAIMAVVHPSGACRTVCRPVAGSALWVRVYAT
jgi:D-arabinose 1-dehydrogenase-like Zn-dependent alcohol dehydrogenase